MKKPGTALARPGFPRCDWFRAGGLAGAGWVADASRVSRRSAASGAARRAATRAATGARRAPGAAPACGVRRPGARRAPLRPALDALDVGLWPGIPGYTCL